MNEKSKGRDGVRPTGNDADTPSVNEISNSTPSKAEGSHCTRFSCTCFEGRAFDKHGAFRNTLKQPLKCSQ